MRERYQINSIIRAGNILKCLAKGKGTYKISELAALLKLDRSTTYRLLLSLEKCQLVEKNQRTGEYSLGVGTLELGSAYLNKIDLIQIARPIMARLAQEVQETVHLAILSDTETLYIDKVDSPRSLGVMSKVGQRSPLHCTALGKALLAFQNSEEQARIIKKIELKPFTGRTITSKKALKKELQGVRIKGYALDRREIEDDVECIAAPIRDHLGNAVAAISISGPQKKINTPQEKIFIQQVREAAKSISAKLGFLEK